MYVTHRHELKLRKVEMKFTEDALVTRGVDKKYRETGNHGQGLYVGATGSVTLR